MSQKKDKKSKKKEKKAGSQGEKSHVREIIEVLLYGLALLMFFRIFVFQNFQIPTSSMENNLLIGDHITANMFVFKNASSFEKAVFPFRDVKRGDVIVFKYPGNEQQDWIKRCIGLPGDHYQIINDRVYINGEALDEEYPFYKKYRGKDDRDRNNAFYPLGYETSKPGLENFEDRMNQSLEISQVKRETRQMLMRRYGNRDGMSKDAYERVMERFTSADENVIPDGFYLMMGDNRNNSNDSRSWGLVPREFVQGRAWLIWWSYGERVNSHEFTIGEKIKSYAELPVTFFTRTHWSRCFNLIK
jgi:signal peptidase I